MNAHKHNNWIKDTLDIKCLCPFISWSPNPKCDDIWKWKLWEVSRLRCNTKYFQFYIFCMIICGFPRWLSVKESTCQCRRCKRCGFHYWLGRSPGGGNGNHSSIPAWKTWWTEEVGGLQSWGCKESDMTEHTFHATPRFIIWLPSMPPL